VRLARKLIWVWVWLARMAIQGWVWLARKLGGIAAATHPRTSKANPNVKRQLLPSSSLL